TQTLAGEGSYTIKLRARKNITPDAQQPLWLESAATAMTESFTWADEVKYTPVITSLTLDDEPNWINVRWSEVPENDEYIVTAVGENSAWKITQTTASALIRLPVNGDETVTVTVTASLEDGRTFDSEAKTIHTQWADMVVLTAPVVTLTAGEPDNVKATWAAIPGATKYIVAVDGKEPFEATHTEVALTAAEGETVAVTVQAVCELATNNYAYGAKSGKVSLKCSWIPVVTLALSDTPNVMTISWDEVPGATSYEVVLNGEDGITYDRSCADTSVQIAVNGGVTYTASVYAVFPTAADSAKGYSQSVEAAWDDMVVLTAPNVTMAVTGVGYVTISWDEVPGADRYEVLTGDQSEPHVVTGTSLIIPAEEDATCWAIVAAERETPAGFFAGPIGSATLENVDWTPVLEVYLSSEANIVEMHWTELDADHGFVVEVTINGVTSEYTTHNAYYSVVANGGDTVSARVAALDVNGMPVVWSTVQTVTAQWDDMVTLTAPVATAAWNDETQQVTVTWSAVPGADSYRVYQGTESDGEGKYASVSETAELSYTFTVEPGCAYKYMVQAACDVNGKTLVGPAGSDVWVAAVDPTVAPANVQADTSRANYVTFSWDACYGAVKYGYTIDGIEPLQLRATTDTSVTVFLPDYGAEKKFRVWAEYSAEGDVQSEESAIFFTPVWDEPAIDLPEPQFTVQLSDETGYLLFAWEDIPDATSYTVLANCFDGETPLSFTQENITGNSVKLLVEEGYEYFVTMQAHYVHQETGESFTHTNNSAQLTVDADWPMPAPVVSIDMTEANIFNVVWDAVPGATSYDVKVERCLNGVWQPYNSLNGLTTTSRWFAANGDGSEYRFSVRAIGVGEVSDWTITTAYATWEDGINLTARTVTAENVGYDETTGLVDVRLTWEGEADATGYLVSYRPGTAAYESEWVLNNSGTCTLQLQEGVEYTIVVCGYFELEGYSTPHYGKDSEALKHTPAFDPDAMGMPTNVTVVASETPNYVTVNWSVVEGAEWYTVMVGNDDFLFDQPNVSMPVPCNGTYAVKVCAWTDDPENHGPWSDPVTITTNWADSLELTPPVVTVDTSVTNVITVRWSAIEDASKYLFRIEKKVDGEYKWVESIHTEATNYSFSANNDGTEYRFIVFAKGVHPVTSEELMSDSGRATGVASWENGIYLAAPAGELDTSVPNLLQVTWNEVEGADEYWLTVEQEDRNGVWIELDDHYEGEGTEFACVVNGDGSRYRFTLRSVVIDAETGDALFSENGMEDVEFIASWEDGVCLTPRELTFELTGYDAETEDVLVTVSWENEPGASSYSLRYDSRTGGIGWNTVDDGSGQCVMEWINGATYEIRIDGSIAVEGYDEKTVTYSETFVYTVDYDPYAISNLAVDMSTPNMFHLTWDEAPAGGYYCVYAEKLVDGEYVLVGEAYPGETAYWYSANSDGAEYRFTVYMVISDDGEGNLTLSEGSSVTAAATWTDGVTLDTPVLRMTDCETWGATRNVTFAWDVDPDATSYLVEYARKGDSVLRRFSSSGTITLALDAGIEYTVRVKAEYNSDDIWFYSELSNAVTYPTFADAATLPAPNARVITSTPNEFRIEWSAVEEATNGYCVSVEKADENGRFVTERCYYMTATYDLFLTNGDGSQYRFNVFALSQDADGNQLISANGLDGTVYTATWADGVNLTARTLNIESTGYRDDGMVEVTATWENEEDAVSYELYYWNDNGDAGYEYCDDGSGAIRFWMTEGETYNFWLRGYFKMYTSYISGPISETVTFTPEYEHDDPVTMGSLSMDMSTPNVFALGWDAVPGASEYTVQVDKLVDGAYVQQGIWPVTTNSFTYEANNDGATYRFTVWAAVEDPDTGVTTTTDSVSMDAVATWEGGVRLIAPVLRMTGEEQGAHDSYYNVTFQWDVDPAADGYIVAYSGGAEPWRYTTLTDGTGTITLDCSRGYPHDVRVQAYMLDENGDKITSAYSNTVTWPTISAAIAAPEAVMDLSEPNMIEVTWEPVTGAEEYWVTFEEMNEDGLYCVWYTYVLRDINPVPHAINGNGTMHRASVRAVRTDSATGKKIISENGLNPCEFEATWENGVILTPRTLHFTANSYNEETDLVEVLVSWDYEPGVTRYDLSYYTYDENGDVIEDGYAQITDGGSSYGFELKKGVEYEFSVRGYCKLSSGWSFYGPGSEVFTYVPAYGVDTLGVPEITLSIDEDGYVLVEWDDDPNAFSYTVYCSQSENTQAFDETYVDAWDDDGNRVTSYRFIPESREYAVKVCANWEENGEILHGDCGETKYINPMPDAPANLTATQSETPNYMTVTWDAVENATSYCVTVIDAGDYRIFDVPADTTSLTV
ncbi:MAG: hypothetical protein IKK21_11075, partial [Clostridia bacterium]|nr:hypothetical protein [Clostridia bacterium]